MTTCKITVLKKIYDANLAETYRRPDVHQGACPYYVVHMGSSTWFLD